MSGYVKDKAIVTTGAGAGFGRLVALKAAERGAAVTCDDVDGAAAQATADDIVARGERALGLLADVTRLDDMTALVQASIAGHGGIDVIVNNAGIMPLAFLSDHAIAYAAWTRCIDINIKGVLNGMIAAHDPMIAAGRGHIVNTSSIYGNFPVTGAAVYGTTRAAINFLSESFRLETRGKIKVTMVKPTGVPGTGLGGSVINPAATMGIIGPNMPDFMAMIAAIEDASLTR